MVGDMEGVFTPARLVTQKMLFLIFDFIYEMDLEMEVGRSGGNIPLRGVNHCRIYG